MKYTVIIQRDSQTGVYVADVPVLPGCVAQADTRREVVRNIKLAMKDYVECLVEDALPVPQEVGRQTVELEVVAH